MKPGKSLESSVVVLGDAPFEVFAAGREPAVLEVLAAGRRSTSLRELPSLWLPELFPRATSQPLGLLNSELDQSLIKIQARTPCFSLLKASVPCKLP